MSSVFHCLLKKKKISQKEAYFSVIDFRRTVFLTQDLRMAGDHRRPWEELGVCASENHVEVYFSCLRPLNYAV